MKHILKTESNYGKCEYKDGSVSFTAARDFDEAFFEAEIELCDYERDAYVFAPACIYDGNRYKKVRRSYPPQYYEGETEEPRILYGIPALDVDGGGSAEFTVADMASPIIGVFYKHAKEALFLYTEQQVKGKNIGFKVESGRITVSFPANREYAYRFHLEPDRNVDKGISVASGEEVRSPILIETLPCDDIPAFYDHFLKNRKKFFSDKRPENGYTDELKKVMINHFNDHNFSGRYYGNTLWITWMAGWCGGGMSSYPLYLLGGEKEKKRAEMTLDWMTDFVSESGLLHSVVYNFESIRDDSGYRALRGTQTFEEKKHLIGSHLVRRSGDVLIFLIKQLLVMPKKEKWVNAAKGISDALVKIFKENGTFGQYVDINSLKMKVAMSSGGASCVGGLVLASKYFDNPEYLQIAKEAGEYYYKEFTLKGVTSGATGDNMTAPESESAYALVESYVLLYETTGDEKWLKYAKDAANQFASWVMTYSFKFPAGCEFGRLGINTVGSVFANVQNKHSAPGICTFSGDAVFRLYKYTGEKLYLELIKDVAYFMPQCVSTEERPIYDWDHKYGDEEGRLPPGYICERVNTSDWEYDKCVGGVFNVSCWCETSLLLTFLELMDKPEMN